MKTIQLTKQKIGLSAKVPDILMEKVGFFAHKMDADFIRDTFTIQLEAFIACAMMPQQIITLHRAPQSFWSWLLRRPQSFTFVINCREALKEPPQMGEDQSVMLYEVRGQQ